MQNTFDVLFRKQIIDKKSIFLEAFSTVNLGLNGNKRK